MNHKTPELSLHQIAERLNAMLSAWIDNYRIIEQEPARLVLAGSFDLCYYHDLELEFTGLLFCDFPENRRVNGFGVLPEPEKTEWAARLGFAGDSVVLNLQCAEQEYTIAARAVTLREGMVYYYQRENLQPGERIAPWVQK